MYYIVSVVLVGVMPDLGGMLRSKRLRKLGEPEILVAFLNYV